MNTETEKEIVMKIKLLLATVPPEERLGVLTRTVGVDIELFAALFMNTETEKEIAIIKLLLATVPPEERLGVLTRTVGADIKLIAALFLHLLDLHVTLSGKN